MKHYLNEFSNPADYTTAKAGQNFYFPAVSLIGDTKEIKYDPIVPSPQMEFVDLGLSVKWGTMLIGATNGDTSTSWYGNYYAWGETETKSNYRYENYIFGEDVPFSKYDTDGKTVLESVDDVATVTNSAWRMPTQAECEELITLPNQLVNNYNGVSGLNGRLFTGTNGNTLFIPAAGDWSGSIIDGVGSIGHLWSSSLYLNIHTNAYYLYFNSDGIFKDIMDRPLGYSVLPILDIS